jgi:hypothetical protein
VEGVCVEKEEDMMVAMCHIAECITFNKQVDFELFNVEVQRQKIIDVFLTLLNLD